MNLPKNIDENEKSVEEGEGTFTIHTFSLMQLTPINLKLCQPEELKQRCDEYFEKCIEDNMKPSMAGFALAIGVSRVMLGEYISGRKPLPDETREILLRYHNALVAMLEEYMLHGKINPVSGIFLMKNSYGGYKDQQDIVVNNTLNETPSEDKLIEEANLLLNENAQKAQIDG